MKKILFLSVLAIGISMAAHAQGVKISSTPGAPHPSSVLEVESSSQGFLPPRMTAAQRDAILNPATGLQIFNTDCNVINFNAGTPSAPQWAIVSSSNVVSAGVTIASNLSGAACQGSSITFTATPAPGIPSPSYQWKVNGNNAGTNSATFATASLNNGDVVTCVLSSSSPCVSGSPATSNALSVAVNPPPSTPGTVSGPTAACAGSTGHTYSISAVQYATSYSWSVPAGATITSNTGTSISVSFGSTSGNVGVTASSVCGTSAASTLAVTLTSGPVSTYTFSSPRWPNTPISFTPTVTSGVTYAWTFSGGSPTNSTVQNPSSTWSTPGIQTTSLTATSNTTGCSSTTSSPVTIVNPTVVSFTTPGTTTWTPPNGVTTVEVLVVGGGGGGGGLYVGGGGGGGGVVYNASYAVANQPYTVTVGAGGTGSATNQLNGGNGQNSVFGILTANGGGGGGSYNVAGLSGASGGGAGYPNTTGGTTNIGGQGNAGSPSGTTGTPRGGGGGGAGSAGGNGLPPNGGNGLSFSITGSTIAYGGGGGGGSDATGGSGGTGGGGNGGSNGFAGANGVNNLGGGGGGAGGGPGLPGGSGGTGVVILRY